MKFLVETDKKYKIEDIMTREIDQTHEGACDICGKKQNSTSYTLEEHKKAVHGAYSERKYPCDQPGCSKAYLHSYQLETHQKASHRGGYICDHCGKSITTQIKLSLHIKTVHKKESLNAKCRYCEKVCNNYTARRKHMLKAHGVGKCYKCEVCEMKFIDQSNKTKHELTHGQPAFECPHCGKKVASKHGLKAHMRLHTGELFECPHCPWKGNEKNKLKRHKGKKHKQEWEEELANESLQP